MKTRFIFFLILNFAALGLGGFFTSQGVTSNWYIALAQAPWTPPGWVFGITWTLIMLCFTLYMAYLYARVENKKSLLSLFIIQWVLNVSWNPIFFKFHAVLVGLVTISLLTALIGVFIMRYWKKLGPKSVLLFPYFVWLVIATSLNLYILLYN